MSRASNKPLVFLQTVDVWSEELNQTVIENVTVAKPVQTALRKNPVYTQVTMIIIQGWMLAESSSNAGARQNRASGQ